MYTKKTYQKLKKYTSSTSAQGDEWTAESMNKWKFLRRLHRRICSVVGRRNMAVSQERLTLNIRCFENTSIFDPVNNIKNTHRKSSPISGTYYVFTNSSFRTDNLTAESLKNQNCSEKATGVFHWEFDCWTVGKLVVFYQMSMPRSLSRVDGIGQLLKSVSPRASSSYREHTTAVISVLSK